MNTVAGYAMSSWERGYGDFVMKPDLDTLRPVPWQRGHGDVHGRRRSGTTDSPVVASPRQILRRQLDRLAERGWKAMAATELEFIVFRDTYEEAWHKGYRDLEPANLYNVDYSMLGTVARRAADRPDPREMAGAGMRVENSKGECNFGQHEINFPYEDALRAADTHTIYKNGAKEIAAQEGMAITFMAKYDEREGNSCHIHLSLRGEDGKPVFADDSPSCSSRFLAGQLACLRELTLFMRAEHQLLQALRARARSRRPRSPGAATTARARCAWSARASRCGWRAACRAATSTPTSRSPR